MPAGRDSEWRTGGLWSLTPLAVTLVLAFVTRSALIAMLLGAFTGTLMLGAMPGVGLNQLFQASLGNADFIWICQIVILIGILFELFKRAGVLGTLARRFTGDGHGRRRVELTAWGAYMASLIASQGVGTADEALTVFIAAIAGGGIFGDHASPVSDTSVLASVGAGSDHMDHVITQLPYALVVAGAAALLYWLI